MVPLVVGDIRLPVRRALTSIARGYQIIWFSFLVQSYMPSIRGPMVGPPRSGSQVPGGVAHRNSEDSSVDAREVDMLLSESEIGVLLARWSLYCGFLARKCWVGANPFFWI